MSDVTSESEPARPSAAAGAGGAKQHDDSGRAGQYGDSGRAEEIGEVDRVGGDAADGSGVADELYDPDPPGISPITRAERRAAEAQAAAERMGPGYFPGGFGQFIWALTRLAIGFVFLWAFLDKLFGWGRNTPKPRSWLEGGSPTSGYLTAVDGPFADFFHRLAGKDWVDWLFMIGLAGIGLALILGIGMMIAAITGTVLLLGMWLAALPITTNPFVDDHIIYALVIIGIAATGAGLRYSLAPWWRRTPLVRELTFLR